MLVIHMTYICACVYFDCELIVMCFQGWTIMFDEDGESKTWVNIGSPSHQAIKLLNVSHFKYAFTRSRFSDN